MKRVIYIYLMCLGLFASCTKELPIDSEENQGARTTLSLTFPVTRSSTPGEGSIGTLRLIIFATNSTGYETGEMVLNRLFTNTDPAATTITISEIVTTGYKNIFLIGNETDDMDLATVTTTAQLRNRTLDFDPAADLGYLKPPFPMYSEYKSVYISENGATKQYGNLITINTIERTVAKLTLSLDCTYADLPNGRKIELTDVYVVSAPLKPYLSPRPYNGIDPDADYFICDERQFYPVSEPALLVPKSGDTGFNTPNFADPDKGIDFYIPEHILTSANKENYTYIRVTGRFKDNPTVKISYKIPLGNGLGATRAGNNFTPEFIINDIKTNAGMVQPADITIQRNMWYKLAMTIKSGGEIDGMQVIPTVTPWNLTDIDGTMHDPYINVSSVAVNIDDFTVRRVYFWSNQKNIAVESTGSLNTTGGSAFTVGDIFDDLTGVSPANFNFNSSTGVGYFDISSCSAASGTTYLLYLTAGNLRREIEVKLNPALPLPAVQWSTTPWVGTFHRAEQVGERVIHSLHTGAWTAAVASGDFIVLERGSGTDPALKSATPGDAESFPVSGSAVTVSGNGRIAFRVGMKSKYTAAEGYNAATAPVRYGVITLTHNGGTTSKIYVRQGEEADYLMRPSDAVNSGGFNSATRPDAQKFTPYNLTDPRMDAGGANITDHKPLSVQSASASEDRFTAYPTQAGAFFQWANNTGQERRAYHPTNPTGGVTGWITANTTTYWSTLGAENETCPQGYRRPNDGSTSAATAGVVAGSEMRQSLYLNPNAAVNSVGTLDNTVWGYYADGFFDRRAIQNGLGSSSGTNGAVTNNTKDVAYMGRLFFNPATNASIFFPAAGVRDSNGTLFLAGSYSYYQSSSAGNTGNGWVLYFYSSSVNQNLGNRNDGFSVRCIVEPPLRSYTVTFDKNGGGGTAPASVQVTEGGSIVLPGQGSMTPPAGGYTFASWSTTSGVGNTVQYTNSQSFTPTANITLFAVWTPLGGSADILYFDTADGNRLKVGKWGGSVTQANMAFFQFGSVIGFTNNNDDWAVGKVLFNTTGASTYGTYSNIPRYNNDTPAAVGVEGWITSTWHTGANVKLGKGDPCKLVGRTGAEIQSMSAAQIDAYNSGWCLPTANENVDFVAAPTAFYGSTGNPFLNNTTATYWGVAASGSGNGGWFPIPGNRNATTGRTTRQTDVNCFLPACGLRNVAGIATNVGVDATYWSSTMHSNTHGTVLYLNNVSVHPRGAGQTAYGFGVRCVSE